MPTPIKPTHTHDCDTCEFVTSTHGERGITDWYVHVGRNTSMVTIIGRHSSDGPDYWSMDVPTLQRCLTQASLIVAEDKLAWSEMMILAHWAFEIYRTDPAFPKAR